MTNEQDKQHLQELAAYRFTVDNLRARVAELEAQLAEAPQAVPASAIAGAVFDFAGYLTTRPHNEAIHCSEAHEASPMVEAITEWCKRRGLCTDGANVENWRQAIATHPTQQGLDAAVIENAERFQFIVDNNLILSGGTKKFGWPIAPFGKECVRYIDKERATQAAKATP